MALQDLGDVTLQAHLGAATPGEHAALYRQAVALIDAAAAAGRRADPIGYLPYRIAFDVEKLTWELDFFVRHFVEAYRGAALTEAERARDRRGMEVDRRASWPPSRACCVTATITAGI